MSIFTWLIFIALLFIFVLQVVPPLVRIYLRKAHFKQMKFTLFVIAFILLSARIIARCRVLTDDGIVLLGSLRTNTLVKCVYLAGCYEPALVDYLKQRLGPEDIFVDIGANTGIFSLTAAQLGAEVISVEASPMNCRLFRRNMQANGLESRITLINAAAGNRDGKIRLFDNLFNGMWSSTVPKVFWYLRPLTKSVMVPEIKVDDIVSDESRKRVRLVKIDVEGAELRAIRGLRRLIADGGENLEFCVEFSPDWLTDDQTDKLFSIFRSNGYTAYTLVNKEVDFQPYGIQPPKLCLEPPDRQVDVLFSRLPV